MDKMNTPINKLIGSVMRFYRRTPFQNSKNGSILAKLLSLFVRLRKQKVFIKQINGVNFEIDLEQIIDSSLYFSGTFESLEESIIETLLMPGMVAMDIGANFGYHTFRMARRVQDIGMVYAFEPTEWAFEKLQRNASINAFNNIRYFKVGLGDMDNPKVRICFQSSYRLDGTKVNAAEEINVVKLDTFCKQSGIQKVDFIKLDVDGYEGKVVRGAYETLRSSRPIVLMEINPEILLGQGDDYIDLISILVACNYTFKSNGRLPVPNLDDFCRSLPKGASVMILAIP